MKKQSNLIMALLIAVYVAVGSMWVNATPMQGIQLPDNLPQAMANDTRIYGLGPDEKEHQLYIESIAAGKGIPKPSPDRRTDATQYVSYQAQHPPVFYTVAAVVWKALSASSPQNQILAIRWMCLILGGVTAWFSFCIAKSTFDSDFAGLLCGSVVAFTPMFGHMHGNISNEPMAMALVASSLYAGYRARVTVSSRTYVLAGVLFGLALATRLTAGIWLPGLLILSMSRQTWKKAILQMAPGIVIPVLIWMLINQVTLGSPLIRTFHRPLIDANHSVAQLMGAGIQVAGSGITLSVPVILLWVSGCASIPMWLMQFHMGFDIVMWSGASIVAALLVLLVNLDTLSKVKRGILTTVPPFSVAARLGGLCAVVLAVTGLLQQLLYSDWDVVFSTGRYSIAAALGGALLVCGAWDRIQAHRIKVAAGLTIVLTLVAFDIFSVGTVKAFYRDKPTQDAIQYVEKAN